MEVGFKGNPNIGSVVLNKFKESEFFKRFAQNFEAGDRIFIISSIFGGTGAAGFPLILKNIRDADPTVPHHSFLNDAPIGAVTLLPYFAVRKNERTTINSDTFISKTKAALHYYSRNVTGNKSINALYYIGDNVTNEQMGADGAAEQTNRAHFIELAAALSIVDFMDLTNEQLAIKNGKSSEPLFFEFGLQNQTLGVKFSDLAKATYEIIAKPLTQFALFRSFMYHHYEDLAEKKGEAWANDGNNKLNRDGIDTRYKQALSKFQQHFKDWLDEMKFSNISFNALNTDLSGEDLYNLVEGAPEKKGLLTSILKSTGVKNFRNRLSENSSKFDHLPGTKKLLALMSKTTDNVFENNINH